MRPLRRSLAIPVAMAALRTCQKNMSEEHVYSLSMSILSGLPTHSEGLNSR